MNMEKGLLYCAARDTDCMEMYAGNGTCRMKQCVLDDPQYLTKEKEKEQRRNELLKKERRRRKEEQTAAAKIRRQTNILSTQEEIERKRQQMNRCYTRGWTRTADKLSRELAVLEKRMEGA